MADVQILGVALSIWMGFAISLQVRTQIEQDKNISERGASATQVLARLIYFVVGLVGVLGMAGLIGRASEFKGPVFPLGFVAGVLLFLLTVFLRTKAVGARRGDPKK